MSEEPDLHILDDVLSVVGVEEEAPRLRVGDQLQVLVVTSHGAHVRRLTRKNKGASTTERMGFQNSAGAKTRVRLPFAGAPATWRSGWR